MEVAPNAPPDWAGKRPQLPLRYPERAFAHTSPVGRYARPPGNAKPLAHILEHLGLTSDLVPIAPARAPPDDPVSELEFGA